MTAAIYALTDTWNAGAVVFTAVGMNVTNTASAAGSKLLDLQVGGASQFSVDVSGNLSIKADTNLFRDAAGIFGQRNGVNAQSSRTYNTFTDASNYERGVFDWLTSANILTVGAQAAGTGTLRPMKLVGSDIIIKGDTATPAGGSTAARLLFGTTSGFGIYYGSGAPTVAAAAGSLYIRTDNAGANLRLYSNTTGSTVWVAITSA